MLFLMMVVIMTAVTGQDKEELREAGYRAMEEGNIAEAISKYRAVLEVDSTDYDARLALGRLYRRAGECDSALHFFEMMFRNDSTDVEALHGMANCYMDEGKMGEAVNHAKKAVKLMPEHVPSYLLLAKALSFDGQIDEAIAVYQQANQADNTWAEVWAGLGRMYYWKSRPFTAKGYYEKAVSLDPENSSIQAEFKDVKQALQYTTQVRYQYVQEKEKHYQIDARIQRYSARKRLSDRFRLSLHFLLDHSTRVYTESERPDTTRWYDNTRLNLSYVSESHVLSLYGGGSVSDNHVTSYGVSWRFKTRLGDVGIENILNGGYSYFYYWNQVGRTTISDQLTLTYASMLLNLEYNSGTIDAKPVQQYRTDDPHIGENPFASYRASLGRKIVQSPDITISVVHSYYDYTYYSPEYYTPEERLLTGLSMSFYHRFHPFYVYGMINGNMGSEKYYYREEQENGSAVEVSGSIDADNWSVSLEAGYEKGPFSVAIGGSHFNNPYYQNMAAFVALSARF
ncbi:MAG: tetratricopeptide repeat protein [Bacteroidales bacterium]